MPGLLTDGLGGSYGNPSPRLATLTNFLTRLDPTRPGRFRKRPDPTQSDPSLDISAGRVIVRESPGFRNCVRETLLVWAHR